MDTELQQLEKIGQSTGGRNPVQESRYQQLLKEQGGANPQSGVSDPIANAQKLLAFQQQANQPAIQTLQNQIDPLTQRYNDLIASIKQQGQVTSNYAQQAASMDLGRRGLLPQSQEGQTALAQSLLPVTSNINSALSSANLGETQDINSINAAIAQLQSGATGNAVTGALNMFGAQQQAQAQLAAAQAYANAQVEAAKARPYQSTSNIPGVTLNQVTGQVDTTGLLSLLKGLGGL